MTSPGQADFDPVRGTLVAREPLLRALLTDNGSHRGALVACGAIDPAGHPHPALEPALDALRSPIGGVLQLSYRGRALDAWRGRQATAIITPEGLDGRRTLTAVSTPSLPAAIVKAAALGHRPRPEARVRAVHDVLKEFEVLRWWRLLHGPRCTSSGGLLEVIDTLAGLYVVVGQGAAVPTDAGAVLHLIQQLLDGADPLPPLNPLPEGVELPQPAPPRRLVPLS